jgi:hypothetical protein
MAAAGTTDDSHPLGTSRDDPIGGLGGDDRLPASGRPRGDIEGRTPEDFLAARGRTGFARR